jgi:cyclophilin family peptidyl-prolyl cis-trans isomerase
MSVFSRWFGRRSSSPARRAATHRSRPQVEVLERREVPTNDIFTVQGAPNTQVSLTFEYTSRNSNPFWDEIGVYTVSDDQGRVAGTLPNERGYLRRALSNATQVFEAGEIVKTKTELTFAAGTRLAFYIIRNNTLEAWQESNSANKPLREPQAFVSMDLANNDRQDHVHTQVFGDRAMKLFWENGNHLGDRDFNDDVITVRYTNAGAIGLPGVAGQTIPVTFTFTGAETVTANEVGLFLLDDPSGRVAGLSPGDEGWSQAALAPANSRILFARGSVPGAIATVNLPAARFFGLYLVQGGTTEQFLAFNPENNQFGAPFAFFSFQAPNVDGREHIKWYSDKMFGFEDSRDRRHKDFNDFVGRMAFGKPPNTAPFVRGAGIPDQTAAPNAADRFLDMAGFFDDLDMSNSIVRVRTNLGAFDIELSDRATPRTVANFFKYITDRDFHSSIFHRSARTNGVPFVLQGGGFGYDPNTQDKLFDIATDQPIQNEFGVSNTRGTIAMAKLGANVPGGGPNSATSQFFFNMGNNAANLDTQNGGFTVFGRVLGNGMDIVDKLARIPTQNRSSFDSALNELPLKNYNGTNFPDDTVPNNYAFIQRVRIMKREEFLTYEVVSNSNPTLVTATIVEGHRLKLDFAAAGTGTAQITVRATDRRGRSVTDTFAVNVQ